MVTTPQSEIHDVLRSDIPAVLALNNAHALETSMLDEERLAELLNYAFYARGIDGGKSGFLLAMNHLAAYVNPNFNWFKERRRSFVYIDRDCGRKQPRTRVGQKALHRPDGSGVPCGTRSAGLRGQHRSSKSCIGRIPCRHGVR